MCVCVCISSSSEALSLHSLCIYLWTSYLLGWGGGSDLRYLALFRRSGRGLSSNNQRGNIFGDELRLVDAGDWAAETSAGWSAVSSPFSELMTSQTERLQLVQQKRKKPPGLTQEALDCLHVEIFNSFAISSEGEASKTSLDCSICLESFTDGDELICLPCKHRFHSDCLDPWVRSCGDCPYCRRNIVVNSDKSV